MHFSKIRLQGFKSFVDPTELQIHDGLTGVVGPNGCGKSNLLEALRWVMGENRPTQMRGGGMEDVIFQGAKSRAAKHFAEVTLHIENDDRRAPPAFNDADELDVVRRITRDLGSAYKVNGKDARARDVSMMFADLATGAQSPSLVRQGQIIELINAKPQSRRRVLEDAAGISGLYQRRHEAELKLKNAEANLVRSEDVIDQLNSQIRNLDRQAKTAARYKSLSEELRAAEALRAYLEWQLAAQRFVDYEARTQEAQRRRAAALGERNESERALLAAQDALPALRDEEAIAAALVQRLTLALESLVADEARAEKTIKDLEAQHASLVKDQEREGQIEHDASEAMSRLDWEADAIIKESDGEDDAILDAADAATQAHESLTKAEAEFDDLRQHVAREEARAQSAARRYAEAQKRAETLRTAREQVLGQITSVESELRATQQRRDEAETALADARQAATDAEAAIGTLENDFANSRDRVDAARAQASELRGQLSALNAEAKGLAASLASSRDDNPVVDLVEVDAGFEEALGAGFGGDLDAPLTENGSGWQARGGDAAMVWPDGVTSLADHVRAPDELALRLGSIGVSEHATDAMISGLKPGQRLVTRAGDFYRWDGFVRLADMGDHSAAVRLQQRNRLAEIREKIDGLETANENAETAISDAQSAQSAAKAAFDGAQGALRTAERHLTETIRAQNAAQNDFERLNDRLEGLRTAQDNRAEDIALADSELAEALDGRIDPSGLDEARSQLEVHRVGVEDARTAMLDARAKVGELRKARERREARRNDIARERANWQKRLENSAQHKSDLAQRLSDNQTARDAAIRVPNDLKQKHMLLNADLDNANRRLNDAKEKLAEGESNRARADQTHRERETALGEVRELLARLETELEAIKSDRDEAAKAIREAYDQEPEAMGAAIAPEHETLPSLDDVSAKINRVIGVREALGAVNLRADEDRTEAADELAKLSSDREEITAAIAKLRTAIAALNKEGRERLLAAFDEVNANFRTLFTKLFGGGDAHLELVENDDPLNAGLEIFAQPPGKRLTTLSLLSGGEQTLTALALIFAVFLSNPAPICVLDEVDAPLDDANVTRFCDMLDEMTRQTDTRFLIITHHALTMSRMDRLFGVTMREQGVSQLVSVDLREAEKLVES